MDYDSEDGDCLSDNDPDFDDPDTESSSFEASSDLDLDLDSKPAEGKQWACITLRHKD